MVRCFIGFFIPVEIKEKIVNIQKQIQKLPITLKLVEAENLHICLSFLGEVKEERVKDICEKLDSICKRYNKFEVEISGIKLIPTENYVRVLALDVKSSTLENIRKDVESEIGGDSKPLHLTLCRVKKIENKKETIEKIKKIKGEVGKFKIEKISLIKSTLQKAGPIYTSLHDSFLL
jgi:2'-5' RNA ligase